MEITIDKHKRANGDEYIYITTSLDMDCRKSELRISKGGEAYAKKKIKDIHDALKKFKSYQLVTSYYQEVDWYDNSNYEPYETPVFKIKKGDRKVDVDYQTHDSVPKDWEAVTTIAFKNAKRYSCVIDAVKLFKPYLTDEEIKQIKKSLGSSKEYSLIA